ncbi:protein yellow-like [Cloeon dipterum]|uniref:protein yellow-like n=1 Tax=Cloeon dipterum TaxID=197152 RepID=UPI00321FDC0D
MNPLLFVIVLLHLSLATAANFTQVFEWPDGMDYEWPSETKRIQALQAGAFKPENIVPLFMAVFGSRIFLSLDKVDGIPVTLVSLPTSKASTASPKLTPFLSWHMHEYGNCKNIEQPTGLEVDNVGRLWVLDSGSENCNSKLWIFDLSNHDQTVLIHHFPNAYYLHDLVLDETPNGYFAYSTQWGENDIVAFSLEREESWTVKTPGMRVLSTALSPKEEPRQLYLGKYNSTELYSTSVAELRNGNRTANPKPIGKWIGYNSYRMLMDNHGTMYAAFWEINYIISVNIYQPDQAQNFHEDEKMSTEWPFTFSLDSSGTFWMTEFIKTRTRPTYRLLKAAVGSKSYMSEPQTTGGRKC